MCHREVECIKYICGHETPTEGRRVITMIKKDTSNFIDSFTKVDCGSSRCRYSATHALSCTDCSATCKQWCVYKLRDNVIFCQLLLWGLDLHARSYRGKIKNCVFNVARHQIFDQWLTSSPIIHSIFTTLPSDAQAHSFMCILIYHTTSLYRSPVRINSLHRILFKYMNGTAY